MSRRTRTLDEEAGRDKKQVRQHLFLVFSFLDDEIADSNEPMNILNLDAFLGQGFRAFIDVYLCWRDDDLRWNDANDCLPGFQWLDKSLAQFQFSLGKHPNIIIIGFFLLE